MSFRDLFERLNDRDLHYVVPRKYDKLPDATVDDDGDVDIVVHPDQFETGAELCESTGFAVKKNGGGGRVELLRMALRNPETTVRRLAGSPMSVVRMAVDGSPSGSGNSRHRNAKRYRNGEMVDLRDGLAYVSPMDGSRIPVHPSVTQGMLARRRRRECYYVPAPADELAHIVPHCVFDKDGEFPEYYVDRCRSLFETVSVDPDRNDRFEALLARIFFEAADLVFEFVAEERYEDIRPALRRFSDY